MKDMKELQYAVTTSTESYFDLVDGRQSKTTVSITADAIKNGLFYELGPVGSVIYLTIMAHYNDSQGLPDESEIADMTGLDYQIVVITIKQLLSVEVGGLPLFDKQGLSERNKKNHAVYVAER